MAQEVSQDPENMSDLTIEHTVGRETARQPWYVVALFFASAVLVASDIFPLIASDYLGLNAQISQLQRPYFSPVRISFLAMHIAFLMSVYAWVSSTKVFQLLLEAEKGAGRSLLTADGSLLRSRYALAAVVVTLTVLGLLPHVVYLQGRLSYTYGALTASRDLLMSSRDALAQFVFTQQIVEAVVVGLVPFLLFSAPSKTLGWSNWGGELSIITASQMPPVVDVIRKLRQRAFRLRTAAIFSLVAIFGALVGGFTLFINAEEASLTVAGKLEQHLLERWEALQNQIVGAEKKSEELSEAAPDKSKPKPDVDNRLQEIEKQRIAHVSEQAELEKRVKELQGLEAKDQEVGPSQTRFIVSVLSKRLGSVLLLIFLVQILVTLYRYSSRLAAFYDSRADALQLSKDGAFNSAEVSIGVLGPERVDFGKEPRSPIENSIELAREILRLQKKDKE